MLLAFEADETAVDAAEGKTAAQWLWEKHGLTMPFPAPIVPWSKRRHRRFDARDKRSIVAVLSLAYRPPTFLTNHLALRILRFTTFQWFS